MHEFIVDKIPDTVEVAYIDSDSIAYHGAFGVQRSQYKFVNKITGEETHLFESAKKAKFFLIHEQEKAEIFGIEFNPDDWERLKVTVLGTEEEARKATNDALKSWVKHIGKIPWFGFMTEKDTHKTKDIKGLERRYQGNRGGLVSPVHLVLCRQHLLSLENMSMVKNGFEADAIVISKAEKKGKKACLVALDKDLRQAENTYVIDVSYNPPLITIADNNVGGIWKCPIKSNDAKKSVKYNGVGAKWLCLQAVAGDNADAYLGIKGVGAVAVIEALENCTTHKECLESIYNTFYAPQGLFEYTSWDGEKVSLTPAQMLLQHFNLAYQERNTKDSFTFEKWGMENPDNAKS